MEKRIAGDNSENPYVSVIMPAFNGAMCIEEAVRSVIGQTFENWELIIVDDGSQDHTWEIIQSLAKEDQRIRCFRNVQNQGAASARNMGLDLCRGEYAALLDCDDVWYPEKLERQLVVAEKTQADIVYCSYAIVDKSGRREFRDFIVPETTNLTAALRQSVISCSTALLGKRVIEHYRFPRDCYHEDLALWLHLLEDGRKAVGLPEILAQYRVGCCSRASNKIRTAGKRWQVYRTVMGMSLLKSVYYFAQYAVAGVWKYQRLVS